MFLPWSREALGSDSVGVVLVLTQTSEPVVASNPQKSGGRVRQRVSRFSIENFPDSALLAKSVLAFLFWVAIE